MTEMNNHLHYFNYFILVNSNLSIKTVKAPAAKRSMAAPGSNRGCSRGAKRAVKANEEKIL